MISALVFLMFSAAPADRAVDPYGPVKDPRTGKACPATQYKLGLWDEPDFQPADLMTTTPNEVFYCSRLRANLLEKQRAAARHRRASRH